MEPTCKLQKKYVAAICLVLQSGMEYQLYAVCTIFCVMDFWLVSMSSQFSYKLIICNNFSCFFQVQQQFDHEDGTCILPYFRVDLVNFETLTLI